MGVGWHMFCKHGMLKGCSTCLALKRKPKKHKINRLNKNEMITINTKRVDKDWFCYATIEGYDHSFKGSTMNEARQLMWDLLTRKGIASNEHRWTEIQEFDKELPAPPQIDKEK